MKLFYTPGACSLAPHIILREAGLPVELVKVNLRDKTLDDGSDYRAINPKGSVPALQLADGQILSEAAVLVQYIADQAPQANLIAAAGTLERYRTQEWLNFISSEVHKGFSPLFDPSYPAEAKAIAIDRLQQRFALLDKHLASHTWLLGEHFSVADAYLFTVSNWAGFVQLDISAHSHVQAYVQRVAQRPAVQEALRAEGLLG